MLMGIKVIATIFMETFLNPNLPGILHGYPHPHKSSILISFTKKSEKKGTGIS
jgi:hypothetical protein